jgi:putative sigma-54 modulation protein
MQTSNLNPQITITGRHVEITDALRDFTERKINGLHLDYPRIIEAKVILDVQGRRHSSEMLLFCANHITLEASTESDDLYKSIDETVSKIARRMRKFKTRLLKTHRPRNDSIRFLEEQVFRPEVPEDESVEPEPHVVHREHYRVRNLFTDEAIMDMEMSDRQFIVYHNARTGNLSVLYRRGDGDYGLIEP